MPRFVTRTGGSIFLIAITLLLVALFSVESFYLLDIPGSKCSKPLLARYFLREIAKHEGEESSCRKPVLDKKGLNEYGCKVVTKACIDQNTIIIFDYPLDERIPHPFYDFGKLSAYIDGWQMTNVDDQYPGGEQRFPIVRRNSTLDYIDISSPRFSQCQTPIIWASPWIAAFGEFYANNVVPLWVMQRQRHLFDRNIILSPMLAGFQAPKHVFNLLAPFSDTIIPFDELGSRVRAHQNLSRCFETMILCTFKGLYASRPPPKYPVDNETAPYVGNHYTYDGDKEWIWWKAALAGQYLVDYYKQNKGLVLEEEDSKVLQIMVATGRNDALPVRNFLQVESFIDNCSAWIPPHGSGYSSVNCFGYKFGTDFFEDLKAIRKADILIAHHGAELNNGWFMRPHSSVIEVVMHKFQGIWPDFYYRSLFRTENIILYWRADVTKEETWRPGVFEESGNSVNRPAQRDRNTILRWPDFLPIVEAILKVKKSKGEYEKLEWENVRFEI